MVSWAWFIWFSAETMQFQALKSVPETLHVLLNTWAALHTAAYLGLSPPQKKKNNNNNNNNRQQQKKKKKRVRGGELEVGNGEHISHLGLQTKSCHNIYITQTWKNIYVVWKKSLQVPDTGTRALDNTRLL